MARKPRKNAVFHLEGADELNKALRSVGDHVTGLTLRRAAEAGSQVIADEAKQLAPRDTGALSGGITTQPGRIQNGRAAFDIGIGKMQWYGKLIELGTSNTAAKPFLRPAFDSKKDEAVKAVRDVLRNALKGVLS